MSTNYPGSLDNTTVLKNDAVDATPTVTVHAAHHDNISDAIIAIETELGADPSGTYSTVVSRLAALLTSEPGSAQTITPTADVVNLIFKLFNSGSTADFWQAKTSGGTVIAYLNKAGEISAQAIRVNGTLLASTHLSDGTALAPKASPTFTGTPTAPTPSTPDNSTKLATTAYVQNQGYTTLAAVAGVGYAPINSPTFTGTPTAPTPSPGDNSTKIATTAFVAASSSTDFGPGDYKWSHKSASHGNWLLCDGSAVARATYANLFSEIGVEFGAGNGVSTFNLPDGAGRVLVAKGTHADVDTMNDNDGLTTVNRSPKHNSSVVDPGHTHLWKQNALASGSSKDGHQGTDANTLSPHTTGITVGPGGSRPTDTPAYIVCGNLFIHI